MCDDGTSLLEGGTLVTVQLTDGRVRNDEVIRSVEPSVVLVEGLQQSQ